MWQNSHDCKDISSPCTSLELRTPWEAATLFSHPKDPIALEQPLLWPKVLRHKQEFNHDTVMKLRLKDLKATISALSSAEIWKKEKKTHIKVFLTCSQQRQILPQVRNQTALS